eukprot:Pgem_evm1s2700
MSIARNSLPAAVVPAIKFCPFDFTTGQEITYKKGDTYRAHTIKLPECTNPDEYMSISPKFKANPGCLIGILVMNVPGFEDCSSAIYERCFDFNKTCADGKTKGLEIHAADD